MKARVLLLTLFLGVAVAGYFELQKRGWVLEAEQWFVDFLVANGRDAMEQNLPDVSKEVVLVKFDEKDRDELGDWPPTTLDWLMVVKRLAAYDPEVLVIVQPLRWEGAAAEFLLPLRQALLPFPSVAMGFELSAKPGETSAELEDFITHEMPSLPDSEQGGEGVSFSTAAKIPDRALRLAGHLGFTTIEGSAQDDDHVLFVASDGTHLAPSLAAQAVTLFRRAPYATMRLRFGPGARLSLADEFVVPLDPAGRLKLRETPAVPVVDGLELMLPDLGDEAARTLAQVMGHGKAVVVTLDEAAGMKQSRAIAHGLAMPLLKRLDHRVDWALAIIAALLCYFGMLGRGRFGALMFAGVIIVISTGISLAAFHAQLTWWSPLQAYGVLLVGALFCFLWPYRKKKQPEITEGTEKQSS